MIKKAFVLDYQCGNVKSVIKALEYCGYDVEYGLNNSFDVDELLVIPGVGNFGKAMQTIKESRASNNIIKHYKNGGKILGICLGMQLLLESSEEAPAEKGFGFIKGKVKKLSTTSSQSQKINLGWNPTKFIKNNQVHDMYFVHQYYCSPTDISCVSETFSWNNQSLCAGIKYKNIKGFQFHPEKSSKSGLDLIMKI